MNARAVTADISALITVPAQPTPTHDMATLDYFTDDPFAVRLTVLNVPWAFSRDLLTEALNLGLGDEAGLGDVRVGRTWEHIILRLEPSKSEDTHAYIALSFAQVRQFIADTFTAVPAGSETYDVDSWITRIDAMGDAE